MATVRKFKDWSKANKDQLMYMLDNGYLKIEDLQALNNKDNKFTPKEQADAFKRIKADIDKRYSEERLRDAPKHGLDEKRIAKLRKFRDDAGNVTKDDNLLRTKLREQIEQAIPDYDDPEKGHKVLKGIVDQTKNLSDKDLKEYLFTGRGFFNKFLDKATLDAVPDLKEYLTMKPNFSGEMTEKKIGEMFNDPKILDHYLHDMSYNDIDYVARKNGLTGRDLLKIMNEAKVKKDRENLTSVFHWDKDQSVADNLGDRFWATTLNAFGPRSIEAIERGESPSGRDVAGDAIENALFAVPAGGLAAKVGSKLGKAAIGLGSAAYAPVLSEVYDAQTYGEDNPRGEFSGTDALGGAGINLVTPYLFRKFLGGKLRKYGLENAGKKIEELGEGQTAEEIVDEVLKKKELLRKGKRNDPNLSSSDRKAIQAIDEKTEEILSQVDPDLLQIARKPGDNIEEKTKNWLISQGKDPSSSVVSPGAIREGVSQPTMRQSNVASPDLVAAYDALGLGATETAKSEKRRAVEEAINEYLSNQFGDNMIDRNQAFNLFPKVNEYMKELENEKKEEKEKKKKKKKYDDMRATLSDVWGLEF